MSKLNLHFVSKHVQFRVFCRFMCHIKEKISEPSQEFQETLSSKEPNETNSGSSQKPDSTMLYAMAKNHPGRINDASVVIPQRIVIAAEKVLQDSSVPELQKKGAKLLEYLRGRHPPVRDEVVQELAKKFEERYMRSAINIEYLSEEERQKFEMGVTQKVLKKVKKRIYHWEPLKFNEESSLVYLVSRFAPNYATLHRIFEEIKSRDPDFVPETILDYGSGLGSTFWAASEVWNNSRIRECANIEASTVMSTLAARLMEEAFANKQEKPRGVTFREYLPASHAVKFKLVVSGHSMFELPSTEDRLKVALSLWNKTTKYLVLCEQGTKAGHRILMELRSFLLDATKKKPEDQKCQVLAPCPHQLPCPRLAADDGTPCNFEVAHKPLHATDRISTEKYSYVVLHKGVIPKSENSSWPRIVREVKRRTRHTICDLCTAQGTLQRWTFTKGKHSESGLYHIARSSKWGDRLPIELTEEQEEIETEDQVP